MLREAAVIARFSKAAVRGICESRAERIVERCNFKRSDGWDQVIKRAQQERLSVNQIVSLAVEYGRKEAYMQVVDDIDGGYL